MHEQNAAADRDYLQMMYEEHAEHARQHEELRANATTLMTAIIAAVLTFGWGLKHDDWRKQLVAGSVVCVTSILGFVLTHKHYEKSELHKEMLTNYRRSLELFVSPRFRAIRRKGLQHERVFWFTATRIRLWVMWLTIYVLTFIAGATLMLQSLS